MMRMTPEQLSLVERWSRAKAAREAAEAEEKSLRAQVVESVFGEDAQHAGTNYRDLNAGYKIKLVSTVSYRVAKREEIELALDEIEKHPQGGEFLASEMFSWKASLSKSIYDKAPDEIRNIVSKVVTAVPDAPRIEIVPPKV